MGGGSKALTQLMPIRVNVEDDAFYSNIKSAIARDLPWLMMKEPHDGHAVIVGGGPSLQNTFNEIRWRKELGQHVFSLNNTGRWLREKRIEPDAQILLDARPSNARFVLQGPKSYLASQCAPETFDAADNITLWHPHVEGIQEFIGDRETALIGGGTTVGLQAMSIVYALGYRLIHLHGFDSCYRGDEHHAYEQSENDFDQPVQVDCAGQSFWCAKWMVHQADNFVTSARQLADLDCTITVAGDGLIPTLAREMMA